jgi:phosphoribosyl-AMP cyclohydrolase
MSVREIRVDCDQDAILLKVEVAGDGAACHTGHRSCFYRSVPAANDARNVVLAFDPAMAHSEKSSAGD